VEEDSLMATTFTDIVTTVMNRAGWPTSDTTLLARAKAIVNTVNKDVAAFPSVAWPDLQRRANLTIFAPYSTGGLGIIQGADLLNQSPLKTSPELVTGNIAAGMKAKIAGYDTILTVKSIVSEWAAYVTTTWPHASVADQSYTIWQDEYALASDFSRPINYVDFINHWKLQPVGLRQMREYAPWPAVPGKPRYYTLIKPAVGDQRVWSILFYPPPDEAVTIPYEYITSYVAFDNAGAGLALMTADDDEPWMDERYRHILIYGALAEVYRDYKDDTRSTEADAKYQGFLKRMTNDAEVTTDVPKFLPDRTRYKHLTRRRNTPRYDVNGNFDRML
jgi:hypothetical protein